VVTVSVVLAMNDAKRQRIQGALVKKDSKSFHRAISQLLSWPARVESNMCWQNPEA
jgi:hypothetical protein